MSSKMITIVPAYNEEKYIQVFLKKLVKFTDQIVVIDDGSTDDTYAIAKKYTPHVLRHEINLGKGAALKTGCIYAFGHLKAKATIFIDSDDQHDPKQLPDFFQALQDGNQLVFGVRSFSANMPKIKQYGNKFASLMIKALFGSYIPDIPSGYKAMTRKAYKKVAWQSSDYGVELEIAAKTAKLKLPFAVIPIDTIYHDYDRGMTALDALKITGKLIAWRINV